MKEDNQFSLFVYRISQIFCNSLLGHFYRTFYEVVRDSREAWIVLFKSSADFADCDVLFFRSGIHLICREVHLNAPDCTVPLCTKALILTLK